MSYCIHQSDWEDFHNFLQRSNVPALAARLQEISHEVVSSLVWITGDVESIIEGKADEKDEDVDIPTAIERYLYKIRPDYAIEQVDLFLEDDIESRWDEITNKENQ